MPRVPRKSKPNSKKRINSSPRRGFARKSTMPAKNAARDEKIRVERFENKLTLQAIAKKFRLTKERVRQIIALKKEEKDLKEELREVYRTKFNTEGLAGLLRDIEALKKPDRTKEKVLRRYYVIQYLYEELNFPFYKIAALLERDHSSVINLYYTHQDD